MAKKKQLKKAIKNTQNNNCAMSGVNLSEDTSLFDTDRKIPKAEGGEYTKENTRVVDPVAHMARHNNLRQRSLDFEELKTIVDDREQIKKLLYKVNNQLLAYKRKTDNPNPETVEWLNNQYDDVNQKLKETDKQLKKAVDKIAEYDPLARSALNVKSVAHVTVGYCLVYIDLEKATNVSKLWSYAGLHTSSHERYKKGKSGGGNKKLRTALFCLADSQQRGRGPYRKVYDDTKHRLEHSRRKTMTRNTQGRLVEAQWKDTKPSHRHGAALRAIMKHFLSDYWYVGRTLMGLDTQPLYVKEQLGHESIIKAEERGWRI